MAMKFGPRESLDFRDENDIIRCYVDVCYREKREKQQNKRVKRSDIWWTLRSVLMHLKY